MRRRENAGGGFACFDFGESFGLGGFVFGKVAAGFCPREKSAHAGVDGVAGSWSAAQAAQPVVDGVAADRENRTGEHGGEASDVAFELREVAGAGSVLAFGGEEFFGKIGNEGVGADAFVSLGEIGGCGEDGVSAEEFAAADIFLDGREERDAGGGEEFFCGIVGFAFGEGEAGGFFKTGGDLASGEQGFALGVVEMGKPAADSASALVVANEIANLGTRGTAVDGDGNRPAFHLMEGTRAG